jgi:centromere/kinetochore protein ZW10
MPNDSDTFTVLCDSIVNGTFPQSEEVLTSDLTPETIPLLLDRISNIRQELSDEIKAASKDDVGDVDQWISQAKKVQEDIERCKAESKLIVEEHQQLQALREQATDYQRKVDLLETEIEFTETLRRELDNVNAVTQSLRDVEECLQKDDPCAAAVKLHGLNPRAGSTLRARTSTLAQDLKDELRLKTRVQLQAKVDARIVIRREQQRASLEVLPSEADNDADSIDMFLRALDQIGDLQESVEPLIDKMRAFVLQPLRQSARLRMTAYKVDQSGVHLELGRGNPPVDLVLAFVSDFVGFLHSAVPGALQTTAVTAFLPDLMALLVADWLNPGLPMDLTSLDALDGLQSRVAHILDQLKSYQWGGQKQLRDWIEDIPRAWLNKRKAATLDAVRKAFASSKGTLRQVERVERQTIATATEDRSGVEDDSNDWDASWDDDTKDKPTKQEAAKPGDDEEVSGWGFDEDEDEAGGSVEQKGDHKDGESTDADEDDAGEAWGWDDENPEEKKSEAGGTGPARPLNGAKETKKPQEQEVTLTEVYSISEIPDHLVEIIGRDVSDALAIQEQPHPGFDSSSTSRGLLALPTLALAMFRATAPTYYGASASLTDIQRYNDSLYIAERLRELSLTPGSPNFDADVRAMEKFARLAYSKEMETQRLIVWDLLEGAQGFGACTQFPYSQEIQNAVSAVVDRIRLLHRDWKPVLSTSALMQSVGSLVTMVIGKVIASVEEMDDISEPESRRITGFCQQIASLEDLFLSTPPTGDDGAVEAIPMTAVYVSNWLKFQYLINILESSLVDIKYLWTEGELSLEFDADEVVELIRALFVESSHRRSAIAAIKGHRTSR